VIIILIAFLTDIQLQLKKFCQYKFIYQKKDIQIVIRLDEKQKVAHKHRWRDLPGSCSAEHLLNNTLWWVNERFIYYHHSERESFHCSDRMYSITESNIRFYNWYLYDLGFNNCWWRSLLSLLTLSNISSEDSSCNKEEFVIFVSMKISDIIRFSTNN
jgi:hypothetical protein